MKVNKIKEFYEGCYILREFFDSYDAFIKTKKRFDLPYEISKIEYDEYFRGTNADINIPLWASACKNKGMLLNNEVTLEVIKFYKSHGFESRITDGNPVDYIGEQFRFLEYLSSLTYREICDCTDVVNDFIHSYTLDTVNAILNKSKELELPCGITKVFNDMKMLIKKSCLNSDVSGLDITLIESYTWEKNCKIPVEEPEYINSSGLNNCGGRCRIRILKQEGCLIDLDANIDTGDDPPIRACVRGRGYKRTFLNANRLRYPLKRVGERGSGKFERISWEEAIDIFVTQNNRIKNTYGVASRFAINGTGVVGPLRPESMVKDLMALDGGYLEYYGSYSCGCVEYVMPYVYGRGMHNNDISDILNTKLLILWGCNPAETIMGTYTNHYITKLKEKGVRIVVIDPRKTDTVMGYTDEWIGIKPSTDGAMMDAMAYVIFEQNLQDQKFMDEFCIGFDKDHMPEDVPADENYKDYLLGIKDGIEKTPEWAEKICSVPAELIRQLAIDYATTKPACISPGLGPQRTGNGEQTYRGFAMLCALTGNIGVAGGSTGDFGGGSTRGIPNMKHVPNPYKGKIPLFQWTKAVEKGTEMKPVEDGIKGVDKLDSNIKMILNLAGNILVNQHSDVNNTTRILKDTSKCEFIVTSDLFMTPSAKYSDLVLPAPSLFESSHIAHPWARGDYFLITNKVMEPLFECKIEYDWLKEATRKMGYYDEFTNGNETTDDILRSIYEDTMALEPELPPFEEFKKNGGYQYKNTNFPLAYEKQINDKEPFATPSGKIEVFSKALYDMNQHEVIPGVPRYTPCVEGPEDALTQKYPLSLIGYHTKRRTHSIHDNNEWLEELDPPAVWINNFDAEIRGIKNGDLVDVFNDRGRTRIPARVTDRIVKGVVALSQGGWFTPNDEGIDVRGSINMLTHTTPTPLAKSNPQHTNLVEVVLFED